MLRQIGFLPDLIQAVDLDETPYRGELPVVYAARMAYEKLCLARRSIPLQAGDVILTGDVVVACGRRILLATEDIDIARQHLQFLSARRHRVYSAVCMSGIGERFSQRMVVSRVKFRRLCREEIERYLQSGEWRGLAGSYAIQGRAAAFIQWMSGSFSAIVGLPLCETALLLGSAGFFVSDYLGKEGSFADHVCLYGD